MSAAPVPILSRGRRDSLVLLLAWAAGTVDAIGFLGLGHVFTANMTGNAVLLGLSLGQGRSLAALSNLIAIAGFILGVAFGALIVERDSKKGEWDRRVTAALFLEALILAAFTLVWHLTPGGADRTSAALYLLIAFSAVAMGIQSAAVRRLNLPGVATTYVTGTMTSLVAGLTRRSHSKEPQAKPASDHTVLQAGVIVVYGLSALASGFFQIHVPMLVAIGPLLAISILLLFVGFAHREHAARAE
ncbi:MAG TPA: YoaK family protein [Candidatus Solibacter sp.]|nr:YoaK family protein [Candidatus Solibacter sp.]